MATFGLIHRSHYFIRAILLCCLAFYIMGLNNSDALHYYLAPHMQRLLLLCPIPLLFIAFGMLWHAILGDSAQLCDCEHPLPGGLLKSTGVYGMFAIPLLFGLLLPDQALGSEMAAKKGIVYSFPDPELQHKSKPKSTNTFLPALSSLDEMFIPRDIYSVEFSELAKRLYPLSVIQVDPLIFSETIGAVDMYKEYFSGKRISLQGFVFREEDMPEGSFALTRFLVMCCTADAVPFGVLARGEEISALAEDTWVELEGTIEVDHVNGEERLQIKVDQIRAVEQPASPYIFTHPDSVAAFDAQS